MYDAHIKIVSRSMWLWIAAGLTLTFNLVAAGMGDPALLTGALLASGAMAVAGIGFGLWAGLTIARARPGAR